MMLLEVAHEYLRDRRPSLRAIISNALESVDTSNTDLDALKRELLDGACEPFGNLLVAGNLKGSVGGDAGVVDLRPSGRKREKERNSSHDLHHSAPGGVF